MPGNDDYEMRKNQNADKASSLGRSGEGHYRNKTQVVKKNIVDNSLASPNNNHQQRIMYQQANQIINSTSDSTHANSEAAVAQKHRMRSQNNYVSNQVVALQ